MIKIKILLASGPLFISFFIILSGLIPAFCQAPEKLKIRFLDYFFENGSPVNWMIQGDTLLKVALLPDYERESLNRQTDHWFFKLVADSGTHVRMIISKMQPDIYNGKLASDWWNFEHNISCYLSYDRKRWQPLRTSGLPDHELGVNFTIEGNSVYIARLPVYTISDLENLKSGYNGNSLFKIINIGETIEKRPLEIIQLGDPDAPYSVIIRARAHPWEPGGSWVVEGLINKFINANSKKWIKTFCIYIMPMANKDGVARGMTRFNAAGMDINRHWDSLSDPRLCPEKYALESFIEELIKKGRKPTLGIDIHNDDAGSITLATHSKGDSLFIKKMKYFEKLMRENTSFSEEFRYSWLNPEQPATAVMFEDGLYRRYQIEAMVYELNANWISSLGRMPAESDWMETGANLNEVFYQFLKGTDK